MSDPPRKRYKQASLLSFMQSERPSTSSSSRNISKSSTAITSGASATRKSESSAAYSGCKEDEPDTFSQDSDIICLEAPKLTTPPNMAASAKADKDGCMNTGTRLSGDTASQDSQETNHSFSESSQIAESPGKSIVRNAESPSLFDSDSDWSAISEGAKVPVNSGSPTLVYSDSGSESQSQSHSQSQSEQQALGSSLDEMRAFPIADQLPRTSKSTTSTHKLYVKTPTVPGEVPGPSSTAFCDVWDPAHVRMPCSPSNLYPDEAKKGSVKNRWSLIETSLLGSITSSYDIEEAILAYNTRYKGRWSFSLLHQTINENMSRTERDELFTQILPSMVQLTLSLPTVLPVGVPLLRKQVNHSLTFSQQQCASLLANAFFCTFPRRNMSHRGSEYANYPTINMSGMFAPSVRNPGRDNSMIHKLKCLFHYFKKISLNMPTGCVTFKRKVLDGPSPNQWSKSTCTLTECHITSSGLIEDADTAVQADFANKMIGGGVLRTGCVQEEIQFTIHPELIVSRLFTEELGDNEVMIIKGAERFSNYTGYADTFVFTGDHVDTTAFDSLGRRYRHIIAMDATHFSNAISQYSTTRVLREINKAYCGFHSNKSEAVVVATGNWGCGAFKGNHHFKGLLQMMVVAQCNRQIYYSAFGDSKLKHELHSFHRFCVSNKVTVGQLWTQIEDFDSHIRANKSTKTDILQFITKNLT